MPANSENSAVATGLEKVSFHANPKECSNCHTIALISHASKICSKFSKWGFNSIWNDNFQMFKLDLEKAEEPEIKLPTSVGSLKKQEISRKTSISLTMLKSLTVWITTNWKILKEMWIPNQLTYLLRILYAGQEAIVRTWHGIMDCFQIQKGVCQGCILSPCLFNSYAEYIMWNARLDEAQAGVKIARRDINNLRYADDNQPYGRKQRRTKEPLDESERGQWKSWPKTQHLKN